jgi:hypothetical protein
VSEGEAADCDAAGTVKMAESESADGVPDSPAGGEIGEDSELASGLADSEVGSVDSVSSGRECDPVAIDESDSAGVSAETVEAEVGDSSPTEKLEDAWNPSEFAKPEEAESADSPKPPEARMVTEAGTAPDGEKASVLGGGVGGGLRMAEQFATLAMNTSWSSGTANWNF